jgi:cell wall-associated NlpC family hydrolase
MPWKTALYDYVHAKNQAELENSADVMTASVADSAYLQKQHILLRRLAELNRYRGVQPLRNETKLRLVEVLENNNSVVAKIVMRRKFQYRIGQIEHIEERSELERVTLDKQSGKWLVRSLEPMASEKRPFIPTAAVRLLDKSQQASSSLSIPHRSPSVPYINYSILNNGESLSRKIRYDRSKAVQYAEAWWNSVNPRYLEFEVDCTNFVSQCLYAGGAPMDYTGKRATGWWYAGKKGGQELWSFSWAIADSLNNFVLTSRRGLHGTRVGSPQELQLGDIICYDWDGDGRYQHNTIVTAKDANWMPLVNAHTYNARHRYWEYRDSPAFTKRTQYIFIRIADEM